MAHELDMATGRAAMFSAGEMPWHRLGINVAEAQTSAEAIKLAGLDWEVQLQDVYTKSHDGGLITIPSTYSVSRQDTGASLGVVGGFYRPFQNREAFDFMDAIVGEKLAMFETAGALKGGKRVWMMARLPSEVRAVKDDVINPYILLTNSHDGTSALRMIPTTVRVVCQNTLNLALRKAGSQGITIWHTESLDRRVSEARTNLGIIARRVDDFCGEVQAMARKQLTEKQLGEYFAKMVADRAEKQQKKLLEVFAENFENERNRIKGMAGSIWAAFNAVSEYADHTMTVFGKTREAKDDNRLNSIWMGSASRMKEQAYAAALQIAMAS